MNNIGFMGTNLNAAARKVVNAKTPQEAKFRNALLHNDAAREVVDKVDFVGNCLKELDNGAQDTNSVQGTVLFSAQAKKLGPIRRWAQGLNAPLEAITTQAPPASEAPMVHAALAGDQMAVTVEAGDDSTKFSRHKTDEGAVVYEAGNQVVTMNPDGTLLMG